MPGCSGGVTEYVRHFGEQFLELVYFVRADPAGEFLVEVIDDTGAGVGFVPAAVGKADQGGAPVGGIGPPFDVAVFFEVVHQVSDRLTGELGPFRQLADPRPPLAPGPTRPSSPSLSTAP